LTWYVTLKFGIKREQSRIRKEKKDSQKIDKVYMVSVIVGNKKLFLNSEEVSSTVIENNATSG